MVCFELIPRSQLTDTTCRILDKSVFRSFSSSTFHSRNVLSVYREADVLGCSFKKAKGIIIIIF